MESFVRIWRRATTAEIAWIDGAGEPAALTAVPLLDDGVPCVALTYDRADAAASLATAEVVALAVTDSRSLPAGEYGSAAVGRTEVTEVLAPLDEALLTQELRKFPPSRTLADSLLQRRENWWYLPRIVLRLDRIERVQELPARRDADHDALLVRDDGAGLRLDVVSARDWAVPAVSLRAGAALRGDGAPTLAYGHDHSPDRERWDSWQVRGRLHGDRLDVVDRVGRPGLDPSPPRLWERLRRAHAFGRACRRGIAAAEGRLRVEPGR